MNYHDPYESTPSSNNGEASDATPAITSEGRWLSEVQQVLDSRLADAEELGWSDEQTEEVLGADVATVAYIEAQIREGNAAWTARLREYEVAAKDTPDATAVRSHQLDELVTYVRAAQEEARDGMKAHSTSPGGRETAGAGEFGPDTAEYINASQWLNVAKHVLATRRAAYYRQQTGYIPQDSNYLQSHITVYNDLVAKVTTGDSATILRLCHYEMASSQGQSDETEEYRNKHWEQLDRLVSDEEMAQFEAQF